MKIFHFTRMLHELQTYYINRTLHIIQHINRHEIQNYLHAHLYTSYIIRIIYQMINIPGTHYTTEI